MSYTTKYYTEFRDYYDNLIRVDFNFKNFTGIATELQSQEGTGQIYQVEEEKNIFKPIRGSEFSINLLCETNFQLLDFSVNGKRDIKVTVKKNGSNIWIGWATPNQYSEPYISPPYFVSVSALDGLGELKSYRWDNESLLSPIWGIFTILSKIETELFIYESVNIYEETMDSLVSNSPLNQCYFPFKQYKNYTYYEVLADILTGLCAEIQQVNGYWKIARIPEQKTDLVRRKWGRFGDTDLPALLSNDTESTMKFIGLEQDNKLVDYSHELLVSPGVSKMKIRKNSGRKKFFDNADFSEYESNSQLAKDWTFNNLSGSKVFLRNETIQELNESAVDRFSSGGKYITQAVKHVEDISTTFGSTHALEFNIEVAITKTDENELIASQQVRIILEADSGTNYYLDADGSFSTSLTTITFKNVNVNEPKDIQFNTLNIRNAIVPESGTIRIYVYQPYKISGTSSINKWYVKRIEGEVYSIFGGYYDDFGNWESQNVPELALINQDMTYVSDIETEFIFGDWPNNNLIPIYNNGLYRTLLEQPLTGVWEPRNSPYTFTFPTLQNNVLVEYQDYFKTPKWVIRGDILSKTINFDSTIVDYGISVKKYYVKGGTYNLRTSRLQGTFIEIGTWDDAPWILADGTWNDDGIWVDSETWNDTDPTP